jgi:STE24 endopeptidase
MLEELGQDLGFRCSNILIWQTHGWVANAAITGVIPRLRYVLLSDALVEHLRPEEVISVYGHEVGHIKHHHLWYYFGFIAASMVFIVQLAHSLELLLARLLGPEVWNRMAPWMAYAPLEILLLVPYILIVFGYLSRRCERQADIYGSRAASQALLNVVGPSAAFDNPYRDDLILIGSPALRAETPVIPPSQVPIKKRDGLPPILPDGIRIFVNSLERVALLNGMTRGLWTWRHGSIAQRVEFLENIGRDASLADKYDRSIRRLRWGMALGLLTGIAALSFVTPPW